MIVSWVFHGSTVVSTNLARTQLGSFLSFGRYLHCFCSHDASIFRANLSRDDRRRMKTAEQARNAFTSLI